MFGNWDRIDVKQTDQIFFWYVYICGFYTIFFLSYHSPNVANEQSEHALRAYLGKRLTAFSLQALVRKKPTQLRIRHVVHLKRDDQFQDPEDRCTASSSLLF